MDVVVISRRLIHCWKNGCSRDKRKLKVGCLRTEAIFFGIGDFSGEQQSSVSNNVVRSLMPCRKGSSSWKHFSLQAGTRKLLWSRSRSCRCHFSEYPEKKSSFISSFEGGNPLLHFGLRRTEVETLHTSSFFSGLGLKASFSFSLVEIYWRASSTSIWRFVHCSIWSYSSKK